MTLSMKIKNNNTGTYAAVISRQGSVVERLQPQEEADISLWNGADLTITEEQAAAERGETETSSDEQNGGAGEG